MTERCPTHHRERHGADRPTRPCVDSGTERHEVEGAERVLVITQAWSRATPGGAPVAGGYLTIENKGLLPDRLLSGASDAARKIEIHEMAWTRAS